VTGSALFVTVASMRQEHWGKKPESQTGQNLQHRKHDILRVRLGGEALLASSDSISLTRGVRGYGDRKTCGDCGKVPSRSRTIEEEQRGVGVKFADIVVFVEGGRLNLRTLIARYKLYKLELERGKERAHRKKPLSMALLRSVGTRVRGRDGREASAGENRWLLNSIAAAGNSVERRDGGERRGENVSKAWEAGKTFEFFEDRKK